MENTILTFVGFFFAGLAVNLTPCVYPMLTVTASLFSQKDKQQSLWVSFLKAQCYVLGIAVMYSSLGLFASLTGALFGSILQNHWVVLGVSILLFVLALAMFDVYQLQVPAELLQKLGGSRKATYLGLFLSGLVVGIFAAPCVGPPVIALLTTVAEKADPVNGFLSFFIFSMGLGLPYLILGTFEGLLPKVPKSGGWLTWFKHLFGVLLIGFSLFYLLIAVAPQFIKWLVPAMLFIGGIYLGFMHTAAKNHRRFFYFQKICGVAALIAGAAIVYRSCQMAPEKLVWEEYKPYKLALAQERRQPVVIDFSADWCITCHELENNVFSHPQVVGELNKFTRLRVDATDMEAPEAAQALDQFDVQGLPAVIFIGSSGQEVREARVTSYVPPTEFLKSAQHALNGN